MAKEEIKDFIRGFLEKDGWKYAVDKSQSSGDYYIRMRVSMKSKLRECNAIVDVKDDSYAVYMLPGLKCEGNAKPEMMKYLTMANCGLLDGKFEMDLEDGEVRFMTYVNCVGGLPLEEVVRFSLYRAVMMMDKYGDGVVALSLGFSDAVTEIGKAEAADGEKEEDGDAELQA